MTGRDATADATIEWLLAVDPAIAWQVRRDVLGEPPATWRADRARVETQGWGARLLAGQDPDGQWAGGAFVPAGFTPERWAQEGQPWTATTYALTQLREFGLDPAGERARRTVVLVGRHARWDHDGQPYWAGEVEECINGRTVADGAYFGVEVDSIVTRLLGEQQPDGGWNCERIAGSVRSSFDTTINVLEGLWQHERATGGTPQTRAARAAGEEYLLARGLLRRASTGEPVDPTMLDLVYPPRWHFTVLRGLDHFRATGARPDPRLAEAVDLVRARRRPDGRWPVDRRLAGRVWFELDDGPGRPSPWITLLTLRVLRWWEN